jgi:O-antigen/teichoic acid export membrane protein
MVLLGFSNIEWVYTGMAEFKFIAIRSVAFRLIGILLFFIFIKDRNDFSLYMYIMIFSFLGNNVVSMFLLRHKVKFINHKLQIKKHLRPLLLILGTTLAASMYTDMDTVLLGFLSNNITVGLYTAAVKLSKIAIPFVTSIGVIMMPKVAKDFAEKKLDEVQLTLDQTFRFLVFFAVPIVFGLALLAPEFIELFSGTEFLPATYSMRLLSLLPLIIGFGHLFLFLTLVPAGRNKEMLFCVLGGLSVSLVLNIILIPHFQEVGSSVANILSELVVTGMYFYFIRKHFSFTYEWSLLIKAVITALVFIPLVWFFRTLELPLVYTLLTSIISCALTYTGIQLSVFKNHFISDILHFVKLKFNKTGA